MLLFANGFNLFELVIKLSVGLSLLMTALLFAALVLVRSRNAIYRRRQIVLTTRWRTIFERASAGQTLPDTLPLIRKADWFTVLAIYIQFQDARASDDIALRLGIADYALSLLERGDDADKILALNVLGHIRDVRALESAVVLTREQGPELSRTAAHCALRIDPSFIAGTLRLLLVRDDWVRSRVEVMLREVDADALGAAMRDAVAEASQEAAPRLLDYVRFCPADSAHRICDDVLNTSRNPEALAAALRSLAPLAQDRDHAMAVRFTNHEESIVALSALRVLRKCVRGEDRELLIKMTSHPDYWVRLRAAEAAVQLFPTVERAEAFSASLTDRYARDAIEQVLAEKAMVAGRR
jgi:HEAT repeat protein